MVDRGVAWRLACLGSGAVAMGLMASCAATIPDGALICDADEPCPPGFQCRSGLCYRGDVADGGGATDGPLADAPMSDARPVDAHHDDAPRSDAPMGDATMADAP